MVFGSLIVIHLAKQHDKWVSASAKLREKSFIENSMPSNF